MINFVVDNFIRLVISILLIIFSPWIWYEAKKMKDTKQ